MEDHPTRLKRLRMRSWHRGIKEMDLILGGFADNEMSKLSIEELNEHEIMMSENDHDPVSYTHLTLPTTPYV